MPFTRRDTLGLAATTLAATAIRTPRAAAAETIEVVAFDAFPIFDPRPIFAGLEKMVPGRGKALGDLWRTRQFEYTWLRTAAAEYEDFWKVTRDALDYASQALKVEFTAQQADEIMNTYLGLRPWPDARAALDKLRDSGRRLGFLSNFTPKMLQSGIENSDLEGYFEQVLSTDFIGTFKPDPNTYRMVTDAFDVPVDRILFVPFAGWDMAGAKWFGYETFWVNRLGLPSEKLGVQTDGMGRNLDDLVTYLQART
ncbi:MAG: haloacid dehalogenase type II [Hyphomicrobiaceae bacterium]|jgi:2-haloacid dehalogenase|nr:haloacid dehalogenase type II [Hyphomicrobiaceae bacterium]MDX2450111.1 haloacid dehalogenase type II [Hyphomicrobiaceae bacterium]